MVAKRSVGASPIKIDGPSLVTGQSVYADDIHLPGLLYGKILRSQLAHARIEEINTVKAEQLPGVALVLDHRSVPRKAYTTAGQGYPEPSPYDNFIFDRTVRFIGDRVAVVFADSLEAAEESLSLIEVRYRELPAVFDPAEACRPGAPRVHEEPEIQGAFDPMRNLVTHLDLEIGAVEEALAAAPFRVEGTWSTPFYQHVPLETHITLSWLDERGRLVLRSSTQVPFHVRRILSQILDLPLWKIRVIKPRIGGGFGGKQEVLLEDLCALATLRTGRPARIELTREEEFVSSRLMHPMDVRIRLGAGRDGILQALEMEILSNTGAYGTHGATIFFNAGSKTLPLYNKAEHVRFAGNVVYTNLPVPGAYRGYGATEGYFALECAMDELANKLGLDPVELRRRNHIRSGESSPIFRKLGEGREGVPQVIASCGLESCIELGRQAIGWEEKRSLPRQVGPHTFRGLGMGIFMQGSSIPLVDMAAATLRMNEDGSFHLFIGATDIGTGSDTILAQIAAEVLSVPLERFLVTSSDTDLTPFDKGAYASSTTFLSGEAVRKCALAIGEKILAVAAVLLGEPVEGLILADGVARSTVSGKQATLEEIGMRCFYLAGQQQLEASASHVSEVSPPPFAAHFAEVEVDTETGCIKPLRYVAAVDCGQPIHPGLARGQMLGALVNGLGFALYEELRFSLKGAALNPTFFDYKIPTSLDLPQIETILVPTEEPSGPFGAKSVGEICINGPMPVIANAVYDAVGIQLKRAPFTPESVLRLLGKL